MHESEGEGDHPRRTLSESGFSVPTAQDLGGDENDAQSDGGLDRRLGDVDVSEGCERLV